MRFHFDRKPVSPATWLEDYNSREFNSPARSTVPLLDALRHDAPASFLRDLLGTAGIDIDGANLHLEFKVNPRAGKGAASHTDLMVLGPDPTAHSLAIEAKWTEPRYQSVAKWVEYGTSPENRKKVLEGWMELLQPAGEVPLTLEGCSDVVYQLLHRAASAVDACKNGGRPSLTYLVFLDGTVKRSRLDKYRADLQALRLVMGNRAGFPFFIAEVRMKSTDAFRRIAGLKKGERETGLKVREALAPGSPPLFEFAEPRIESV